jgi:hypothetical protein
MNLKLNLNEAIWLSQLIDSHAGLPKVHPSGRPVMPWQGPDEDATSADPLALRGQLDDLIADYCETHPPKDDDLISDCYWIQITVGEEKTYAVYRDVAHVHPPQVHGALGTASEAELQRVLDTLNVEDWYDEKGYHRGPNANGLEMFRKEEDIAARTRPYTVRVGGGDWTDGPEIDEVGSIREGRDFIESYGTTADWGTVTDEDTGRTVVFRRDPNGDGTRWYRAETRQANKEDE